MAGRTKGVFSWTYAPGSVGRCQSRPQLVLSFEGRISVSSCHIAGPDVFPGGRKLLAGVDRSLLRRGLEAHDL